ncbi:amidohydrolase, partial [Providencia stuartii]
MLLAGKIMAATAVDLLTTPNLLAQAKSEFQRQRAQQPYHCPIPPDVKPSKLQ